MRGLVGHHGGLRQFFPACLGIVFRDRYRQALDLLVDGFDVLVNEGELGSRRGPLRDLVAQSGPQVAIGRPGGQPVGPSGDPFLAKFRLKRLFQGRKNRSQRLQGVEPLTHLPDRLADVAVGLDRLAQLLDADPAVFEDVIPDELGGGLVMVERHRVHDGLLQRAGVLLAIGRMRHQTAHVFAHVVAGPVSMIDEVLLPDRSDDTGAHVFPLRRELLRAMTLDEVLGGEDRADGDEKREHRLLAVGLPSFESHADRDRRPLLLGILESERDVGACVVASALVFAERAEAVVDDTALGSAAGLSAVASDSVQTQEAPVAAGEHDLSHVQDG